MNVIPRVTLIFPPNVNGKISGIFPYTENIQLSVQKQRDWGREEDKGTKTNGILYHYYFTS
jgi:hypothetical protein